MTVNCGPYFGTTRCSTGPRPGAKGAASYLLGITREEKGTNLGIYNCRAVRGGTSTSIHGDGRAFDLGTQIENAWSWELVERIRLLSAELGVQCIIHRRRIFSSSYCSAGWRNYTGVAAHFDHAHIELTPEMAARGEAEVAALWARVLGDPTPIKGDGHVIVPPVVSTPGVTWRAIPMGAVSEVGTKGEQVRQDQSNLVDTGFPVGPTGADGFFGNTSAAAATAFQRAAGIGADGKVGPATRAALRKVPSWRNQGVREFQARLAGRGWKIGVDGKQGPETTRILTAFQREKGLVADGKIGPATWTALWVRPL